MKDTVLLFHNAAKKAGLLESMMSTISGASFEVFPTAKWRNQKRCLTPCMRTAASWQSSSVLKSMNLFAWHDTRIVGLRSYQCSF